MNRTAHRGGLLAAVLLAATLAGCSDDTSAPAPTATPTPSQTSTATSTLPPATFTASATRSSTPTITASSTPSVTSTRTPPDARSGGTTTVFNVSRNAFAQPLANLPGDQDNDFFVGNALFNRNWVIAPSSTEGSDGLGPEFNARSCSACHFKDGRGRPPTGPEDTDPSLLFRLSVPGTADNGGPLAEPRYGDQLSPHAILGVPAEGSVAITYTEESVALAGGEEISLRRPQYEIVDLAFGPLDDGVLVSPRVAPMLAGLGLLAALDEATVLAGADEEDTDGDGISGRPNWVWDRRAGAAALGRFGWKANQPSLEQQNAGAFLGDIGITSSLFPEQNCTSAQEACLAAPNGGTPELDDLKLGFVTFYSFTLGIPARRNLSDEQALRGEDLFLRTGCASCHTPDLETGDFPEIPELGHQRIHPYTDLLLHDMGPDLADERPDFAANGREWRTPPLWGIGLVPTVNQHTNFLHDGRARGFAEAILWHGGEAEAARNAFKDLPPEDRAAIIRFLELL